MDRKERAEKIYTILKDLYPNPQTPLNHSNPWELYVAVVLSAQQTDTGVNAVTEDLFRKYKTLDDYRKVTFEEFDNDIKRINFHKNKAKAILNAANLVAEKHGGNLPDSMDELIQLPFVGRKTANVILQEAFGKNEGVVVDTHVKRLTNTFGLTDEKDPEKIERDLMDILPRERWHHFALSLILYGREYFPARKRVDDHPLKEFVI